ncbi:FAD assembly factor SdhE [Acetobacter peroxydans]|jgi:antitoxin CptB|uniref:FAD assembly factor SdhE n=1 Tax=Acetobacter peroxydans TaxID=104098 RepID=A0A4Y3TUS0_9PROT|nr:succinate dehydrogenase assembly factor 2 [Acetobacter peroxydans]NHO15465.1 succinate dehydrogenase assembly factor 2 [Acetobacter peroxydans]GBR35394.1 hypothetical protein AA13755_1211 [Acetobacter peroxydans NBRC 13755]GBR41810.1 hypothetical protein AA0475_1260 [Acetobacter peroxydans]GEB84495.1 hypothetical protein APE01nite_02920 [Acetobacter peroxydans]
MSDNLTETTEASTAAELDARRRRLKFRANHRGTFETDILIGGFVEDVADTLSAAELADMEAILEMPDPDLTDWLFGRLPLPEEKATPMLRRMVAACRARCGH